MSFDRGVAQFGRVLGSGPRGRWFESSHSEIAENSTLRRAIFSGRTFVGRVIAVKIDASDILSGRVPSLDFEYTESADGRICDMLPADIEVLPSGITVRGRVTDTGGYMSLSADVEVRYKAPCDRCLDVTEHTIEFVLERVVSAASSPESRERMIEEDEAEWDGVTDDLVYITDGGIDLSEDLAEALSLELPMRHLCSDGCRGLCPVCGKKITDEHPGCTPEKEIDPRLAILKKLLD